MGACNGYRYHELRPERMQLQPLRWVPGTPSLSDYPGREANEEMLREIAAKPEEDRE